MKAIALPDQVLAFWRAAGPEKWFEKDAAFDREIVAKFLPTYEAAASGALSDWETRAQGAFALLIVLDQFPRNMFRGTARVYAADPLARAAAARAIANGFDRHFAMPERNFFYLPFSHSEDIADQESCVALSRASGDADAIKWAEHHCEIVRRFGRFPHRNAILGRTSTPEEQAYLNSGGFSG